MNYAGPVRQDVEVQMLRLGQVSVPRMGSVLWKRVGDQTAPSLCWEWVADALKGSAGGFCAR